MQPSAIQPLPCLLTVGVTEKHRLTRVRWGFSFLLNHNLTTKSIWRDCTRLHEFTIQLIS